MRRHALPPGKNPSRIRAASLLLLAAILPGWAGTAPAAEPDALQARWTFAEGMGTTVEDSSGHGVTGTLRNGASFVQGRIGYALKLDGVDDTVDLGTNLPLLRNVEAATLSGWIQLSSLPPSGASREILSVSIRAGGPTNSSRANLKVVGDGTAADLAAGGRSTDTESWKGHTATASNLKLNRWYHVAAVLDYAHDEIRLYVDGLLVSTGSVAFVADRTPDTAPTSGAIGSEDRGDSSFFHGLVDEPAVWGRALSGDEIARLATGDQLVARWALDEGTGGVAGDSSGNGYAGLLRNDPAWSPGVEGTALSFDGANDYVSLGTDLGILRNVNAATVMAWIRPASNLEANRYREILSLSVGGTGPTNTSRIALALKGDGTTGGDLYAGGRSTDTETQKALVGESDLEVGRWVHVAAVIDFAGGRIALYRNGEFLADGLAAFARPHTPNTPAAVAALGAQDTGDSNYFHGDMDDVRVYGRVLCPCEIQKIIGKDGLRIWYRFEEGQGDTVADSSGHGVTGTLRNGAAWTTGPLGGALSLDGVNDSVDLGRNLEALRNVRSATLAAWVNLSSLPGSGQSREIISISIGGSSPTNSSRANLKVVGDGTAADLAAGGRAADAESWKGYTATTSNLQLNRWYHLAAVLDYAADSIRLYVDGTLVSTGGAAFAGEATADTPSACGALGAEDKGETSFFHGLLDEVRVYCRGLSAAEIADLARLAPPGAPVLLEARPGDSKVDLAWSAVAGSTMYGVKRSATSGGPYATVTRVSTTTFTDVGLENGTTYYYVVSALNAAGESADSNELAATPNPPPTLPAPVIASPSSGAILNTASPTVTGTSSAPGLTITLTVDGVEAGTTISAVAGHWSIVPSSPLSEGVRVLAATASDGTRTSPPSGPVSVTVDTVGPVVSSPSPPDGSATTQTTPVISASWSDATTGVVPSTASILVDGVDRTSAAAVTADGFTYTPAAPLGGGPHTVTATVKDAAGNPGTLSWNFTVLVPPPPPTIQSPAPGALLATGSPAVSGTSSKEGLLVTLLVDGTPNDTATSGPGGAWSLQPPSPIPDGAHTLTATAADGALVSPPSAPVAVTVDTLPPLVTAPSPPDGSTVQDLRPAISASWSDSGSGIAAGTARILLDGEDVTAASTVTPNGFTCTPGMDLSGGAHSVHAEVRDAAGHLGTLDWNFTVVPPDQTSPQLALEPPPGSFTTARRPLLRATYSDTGRGIDPASFRAYLDGAEATSHFTVGPAEASWTPPDILPDGEHTFSARIADLAGNTAEASSSFRIVAAFGPVGPAGGAVEVLDPDRASRGSKAEIPAGALTEELTFWIEEPAQPFPFPGGFTRVGPVVAFHPPCTFAQPAAIWVAYDESLVGPLGVPEEGLNLLRYDPGTGEVFLVPVLEIDTQRNRVKAEISGLDGSEFAVGAPLPQADRGEVRADPWEVPADGMSLSTITVIPRTLDGWAVGPNQQVTLAIEGAAIVGTVEDLGDGVYRALARSSTPGRVTVTASVNGVTLKNKAVIDFVPPYPASISITGYQNPLGVGVPSNVTLKALQADGTPLKSFRGIVQVNLTGTRNSFTGEFLFPQTFFVAFSRRDEGVLTLPGALVFAEMGTQKIKATVVANPVVSGSASVVVTAGPPAAFVIVAGDYQVGLSHYPFPQPLVTRVTDLWGNPVAGAVVRYWDPSDPAQEEYTGFADNPTANHQDLSIPSWAEIPTDAKGLAVSPYPELYGYSGKIYAKVIGTELGTLTFSLWAMDYPPERPVIGSPADGSTVSTLTPQISGTAQTGYPESSVLRVQADGIPIGETSVQPDGSWSLISAPLSEGPHTLYAYLTEWGYTSKASDPVRITVSIAPPPAPQILTPEKKTNDSTPRIWGTISSGESLTIRVLANGTPVGETSTSGGTWTLESASALSDGVYRITAVAVNSSGVASAPSNAVILTIDTTPPDPPSRLTATPGEGFVLLGWHPSPSPDVLGYNVWRKGRGEPDSAFQKINGSRPVAGRTYCDTPVPNGAAYEYRVTAVDDAVNERDPQP